MSISSEGIIAIVIAAGALFVIIVASLIFWCFCCRRPSPPKRITNDGHGVPLQIVSSPPEGTYSIPLVVNLKTVQPNLDILVRIVAVDANGLEIDDEQQNNGLNRRGPPLGSFPVEIDGHNAIAGLMLYRDALEFVEPGTYFVLAHTLSPDKTLSEVHQFNFVVVGDAGVIIRDAAPIVLGIEPPTIEPCRGEVTCSSAITISHPLHSAEAAYDHIGGHVDAVRALIEQSDVALWYSVDGSFPRTRYYRPFCLPLPPHQMQHRVTVRALSTSRSRGVASDIVEANLTVVTDRYHFFDPSVMAPTLRLQASGSMLYFEDPKPIHLANDGGGHAGGGVYTTTASSSSQHHQQHHKSTFDAMPPLTTQRYDLAGGTWHVMYCMESVEAARHSHVSHSRLHPTSHGGPGGGGAYWCEYTGTPVAIPRDVARIAAFTTCNIGNKTFRSAVVMYDVSLQHQNMFEGMSGGSAGGGSVGTHQQQLQQHNDAATGGKKGKNSGGKKSSKKSKKSPVEEPHSAHWEAKVLHYHESTNSHNNNNDAINHPNHRDSASVVGDAFPPPPMSSYVEDSTLIPTPVMCITCLDVEVAFDDPPRGGMILYTLNDTDPVADLDADTPSALEYRVGSAPIKLLRGEYDQVALTARIVFPLDPKGGGGGGGGRTKFGHDSEGGGGGAAGSSQSYRYGHRFSRHFYVQ